MPLQTVLGTANQVTSTVSGSTITLSLPSAITLPGTLTASDTVQVPNLDSTGTVFTPSLQVSTFTNPWNVNPGTSNNLVVSSDTSGILSWSTPFVASTSTPPTRNAQKSIVSTGYNQGGFGGGSAGTQYTISDNTIDTSFNLSTIPGLPDGAGSFFKGSVFDGRYLYLIPNNTGTLSGYPLYNGVMLQYDTTLPIDSTSAYAFFDLSTINSSLVGFSGGCFDGRYVYLCSTQSSSTVFTGKIVRYDTTLAFGTSASYTIFDVAGTGGVDSSLTGFSGCYFDGRYIYVSQSQINDTPAYGSLVLQYDTTQSFTSSVSYAKFDLTDITQSGFNATYAKGYNGLISDGRYLYLIPGKYNGTDFYPYFIRYDISTGDFTNAASWTYSDTSAAGFSTVNQLNAACFNGRYLYFVGSAGTDTGVIVSFNTTSGLFTAADYRWRVQLLNGSGGVPTASFSSGVVCDGRYVYITPQFGGNIVTYSPYTQSIYTAAAYSMYDISGTNTPGYQGSIFDGRYVYYIPSSQLSGGADGNYILLRHKSYQGPAIIPGNY